MTKLGTLAALAGTSVLAAAAFVRPPTTPVPAAFAKPAVVKVPAAAPTTVKAAAPAFAVTPGASVKGFVVEEIAFAGWGNAVGELGRLSPKEANPEAPMSLSIDADDRVHVLDQVNERISVFTPSNTGHGVWKTIPIGSDTVQDLVVDPRGGYALLDRLVAKHVRFLDAAGKERSVVQLEGQGVPEGGLVTGLFAQKDGFWVEVEHGKLVRVALADGSMDTVRPTIEGRRSFHGGPTLRAARDPQGYAVVSASTFFARVPFTEPVLELVGLESDGTTTYVAAHTGREQTQAPFGLYDEKTFVVALDPGGLEVGRFELPPNAGPEETMRTLTLSPKGELHYLHVGQNGASIRRAR